MLSLRNLVLAGVLGASAVAVAEKGESSFLIVPPTVQLGDRVANGENSIALVWHTQDVEKDLEVRYSQGGSARRIKPTFRTVKVEGVDAHRVYTAVLAGLKPGVKIDYKVVDGEDALFKGSVVAPKAEKQSFSLAVFGDCGCSSPEQAQISYQTYLTKPDMVILTGDLVYSRGTIKEYRKNFFPWYTPEVATPQQGAPLFSNSLVVGVPGNHDILDRDLDRLPDGLAYFYYWSQPLNGPLTENGAKSTPTLSGAPARQQAFLANAGSNYPRLANFSYDYGNAHFTCLDANPYVDWSDPKLRAWLKADLAKAAGKTWRFVVYHHPGFQSSSTHQGDKQMRQVADLFEEGKVDVVFAGHVHNYQRTFPIQVGPKKGATREELNKDDWPIDKSYDGLKNTRPKGIVYLVDGGGGNDLYNVELNGHPEKWKPFQAEYKAEWSFSIVKIDGKSFSLRQIDNEGKEIDRFDIKK